MYCIHYKSLVFNTYYSCTKTTQYIYSSRNFNLHSEVEMCIQTFIINQWKGDTGWICCGLQNSVHFIKKSTWGEANEDAQDIYRESEPLHPSFPLSSSKKMPSHFHYDSNTNSKARKKIRLYLRIVGLNRKCKICHTRRWHHVMICLQTAVLLSKSVNILPLLDPT